MANKNRNFGKSGPLIPFNVPPDPNTLPVIQPPPIFPLRDKKYEDIPCNEDMEFLLLVDREIKDHFNDISKMFDSNSSDGDSINYLWKTMPMELRPKIKTKQIRLKTNIGNVDAELSRLEQLEKKISNGDQTNVEDEDMQIEDEDEEMDEGTDYANNYFDNGESYDENDDADIGPVF